MRSVLLGCVLVLILGALLLRGGASGPASAPGAPPAEAASGADGHRIGDVAALASPDVAGGRIATTESAADVPAAAEPDLESILTGIAAAEARGRLEELEDLLGRVVGDPVRLPAILALLERPEPGPSPVVRRGGVIAIAVAFARWSRGGGPPGLDGAAFCLDVLRGLPRLPAESRALLVSFLAETDRGEVPAIGGGMIPTILSLCRQHPEDARLYATLLERLGRDPEALSNHRAELVAAILDGAQEEVVGPALRAMLALDAQAGSAAARALLADAPPGSPLRSRIVLTLAEAGPPAVAIDVVLENGDASQFAAFGALGRRPEAREELRARYSALVAADLDVRARRMLVSSMGGEETAVLLGIAGTDPHAEVRRQAFLTATVTRDVGPEGLQSLRDAYARSGAAGGVDARCAVMSASNVVSRSAGATRAEALDILRGIAQDADAPLADRRMALARLRAHLPHVAVEGVADLEAPATAAGQAGK